jgi:5'-methylthioadenosine phosphorylase
MEPTRLGIIGGSGLYALESLLDIEPIAVETPYGSPSDAIHLGHLGGRTVAFLSRHGAGHRFSPSEVPYRANIWALKSIGVTHLISISAVGSLKEALPPRSFVVPDNLIDRTLGRPRTFFEGGVVAHVSLADPFCPSLSEAVASAAEVGDLPVARGGTYVCIEGPQFSTRAESHLYRSWGASVIGMTAMPEARLAREAELCYACLAMVTDYDVWHDAEEHVSVELVIQNLFAMTAAAAQAIEALAGHAPPACGAGCRDALAAAIITNPAAVPIEARTRLEPIAGKRLGPDGMPR